MRIEDIPKLKKVIDELSEKNKAQSERIDNLNYMYEALERNRNKYKKENKELKERIKDIRHIAKSDISSQDILDKLNTIIGD